MKLHRAFPATSGTYVYKWLGAATCRRRQTMFCSAAKLMQIDKLNLGHSPPPGESRIPQALSHYIKRHQLFSWVCPLLRPNHKARSTCVRYRMFSCVTVWFRKQQSAETKHVLNKPNCCVLFAQATVYSSSCGSKQYITEILTLVDTCVHSVDMYMSARVSTAQWRAVSCGHMHCGTVWNGLNSPGAGRMQMSRRGRLDWWRTNVWSRDKLNVSVCGIVACVRASCTARTRATYQQQQQQQHVSFESMRHLSIASYIEPFHSGIHFSWGVATFESQCFNLKGFHKHRDWLE